MAHLELFESAEVDGDESRGLPGFPRLEPHGAGAENVIEFPMGVVPRVRQPH